MEKEAMTGIAITELFNSPLETGVRSLVLLNTAFPRAFDLKEMTWLDHLVVHTGDLDGGPQSLHPNVPHRSGELLVRRKLVERGLSLMRRAHMIEAQYGSDGLLFAAHDRAAPFVSLIRTEYGRTLKDRAKWLLDYLADKSKDHLHGVITEKIGRWAIEFQGDIVQR